MNNHGHAANHGTVVAVRGSVVDIRFDAHLPPIYALLHAQDGTIAIEVLAQLDAQRVRGIALTPTQGLARGMVVEDSGGPLKAPVGSGILSRIFDVFGNAIDRQPAPTDMGVFAMPNSVKAIAPLVGQVLVETETGHGAAATPRTGLRRVPRQRKREPSGGDATRRQKHRRIAGRPQPDIPPYAPEWHRRGAVRRRLRL